MPSITGLATTAALNVAKYEIPKVSDLVKQTHYEVKISNIKSKFLSHLVIINLRIIYWMKKLKIRDWFMNLIFLDL